MSTDVVTAYRSAVQVGRDGFVQPLRSEWTKVRTVRGWVVGLALAALLTVLFGVLTAVGGEITCGGGPDGSGSKSGPACRQIPPLGPDGEAVSDSLYFAHQTLAGNGSITARMTSLTGLYSTHGGIEPGAGTAGMTPGTQPWSKAGIMIKQSATQGSAYAAMMTTGSNGVRMQYDYTHDTAGEPGVASAASPQWLRLTRSGDTVTGFDSVDGVHWTQVGTMTLPGSPSGVLVGMFAASPDYTATSQGFGTASAVGGPTLATGTFDNVSLQGAQASGTWTAAPLAPSGARGQALAQADQFQQTDGAFRVTGTGDIAPLSDRGSGRPIEQSLVGAFAGLIAIIVVAAMFITAEYRRGLIRLTLAATPRRGRVLAAKTVVIGVLAFAVGLVAAAVALPLGDHLAYNHGSYLLPVSSLTKARLVVGTAALFAVVAVFALAIGALLRRSAATVTLVIVAIVLPYILAVGSLLPAGIAEWLTRLTPAAAFAIQQSLVAYPQVTANYTPADGYFPLSPWAGFAVLCGYAALAVGLALYRLRRRDA